MSLKGNKLIMKEIWVDGSSPLRGDARRAEGFTKLRNKMFKTKPL